MPRREFSGRRRGRIPTEGALSAKTDSRLLSGERPLWLFEALGATEGAKPASPGRNKTADEVIR